MDAKSEQDSEIAMLEMVYPDECEILEREYPNIQLKLTLPSEPTWQNPEPEFYVTVYIKLPSDYPQSPPLFEFSGIDEHLPDEAVKEVEHKVYECATSMPGFQVIITMISEIQHLVPEILNRLKKEADCEQERIKTAEEEAERRRFEGNRVTVESFNKWWDGFEKDFFAAEIAKQQEREALLAAKLTGKQQFLRDSTLSTSDLTFEIDEKVDDVEIDQSLFQDEFDELDISDEDDDDYDPNDE